MTENTIHGILAIVSVLCIAGLVALDILHGGDGAALSGGLAAIGMIGGYGIGVATKTSGSGSSSQ